MVLSIIFLEDKHNILLHLSIFYEYQQFFQHRICFSIQPPDYQWDKSRDYACYSQWPVTHFSTFYKFILYMLFNHCQWLVNWRITVSHSATSGLQYFLTQDSKIWKFNYGEWRIEKENLFLRPKCQKYI